MNIHVERKLEVNELIIKARWLYALGIFIIGILTKVLSSSNVAFSFATMALLLSVVAIINAVFYLSIYLIKKFDAYGHVTYLSHAQLTIEILFIALITHFAGGVESISLVFFFLPIVSASLIFGPRGAIVIACVSGVLVNGLVVLEYLGVIEHINRYHVPTLEFQSLSITLTKTLTISIFYIIVGIFSGFGSKMLFDREQMLEEETDELIRQKEYRDNELKQLDRTTKLLVRRDMQLTAINKELDKKIHDQERAEKSMLKVFNDLKEARAKTEEESNKTMALISNFLDPIIVIDKEDKIALLNPAAKNIFGLADENIGAGIAAENFYSMANFKPLIKKDYTVKSSQDLKSENPREEELTISYDEQEMTFKIITADVTDKNQKSLGVMKIFYNLTREKMLDRMKSEFISIAAHQLRTPLSAIKWVIKMIIDGDAGKLNEEQRKLLDKGYQSNERIINLVNDMLNVSRIEEGRFGYSFSTCDFAEVLDIVTESLENQINNKKIKLIKNLPKKKLKVYMDKQKMTLVLQNLLENAVKYTPDNGKIEITVEAGGQFLQFKIKDNGVGIPEADQHKLFSKFFRAANVMRMQSEGSGLGLFIVKNIIKRHGGDITFKSKEGLGTEFTFTLPK